MIESLVWASWIAFLASSATIIIGGLTELEYGGVTGVLIVYAGIICLSISGLAMTVAYGGLS